ncbi:MAG TPA: tetratricopeptide repeat protein [Patescibacteria group bacterium]|nr:tetratricopeptide repeat protein [Patescibacteria group bacterium]
MLPIITTILMTVSPADTTALPEFDKLWNFGNPAATEQEFRKFLPQAQSSGNSAYHAELLTQIARTLGLQRKYDDAHAVLDSTEKIIPADNSKAKIRYNLERGRVFNSSGNKEKAKEFFRQAWQNATDSHEDYYAVDAAHMMGIAEASAEEQLAWNLKALKVAEGSAEPRARKWLGALYNNIGWTYHDNGEFQKALEIFQKALDWRIAEKHVAETRIAKWTIGRTYRSLGRIDDALNLHNEILKEIEATNAAPNGYVFEEIGECQLLQKNDAAKDNFLKAYELLSKDAYLQKNEAPRLERLKKLAGL